MKAWLLKHIVDLQTEQHPLEWADVPVPEPGADELLIKVSCCGVCHTELDEIEGRTAPPHLPVVPGHQVVGTVAKTGKEVKKIKTGDRVGVAWIFSACGKCEYCKQGLENLCPSFKATGRDVNGGYAEYMTIREEFAFVIPTPFSDVEAAPLLCAGAIGYRSIRLAGIKDGSTLGLIGFGASGHLVLKMARALFPNSKILVFARSEEERNFARSLGAWWAGDISDAPPLKAHAIIETTPVWKAMLVALQNLIPGGRLVINVIRKEATDQQALTGLNYQEHLWMEKEIKSVANITSRDVREFLELAARIPLKPEVEIYPIEEANRAILDLKHKHVRGAKVLQF